MKGETKLMSVIRLSTNKYKIIIELGYDLLGNRKRKTQVVNGTKSEALKVEAELKSKYYHIGKKTNIQDLTFEQFSEIFLDKYCKDNISLITIDGYQKSLKRILPIIGNIKLKNLKPLHLDTMYQELKIGIKGEPVGYHSMYSYYKLINVMLNQAVRWELIDKNPNLRATKPKRENTEKNFYDLEQVKELHSALDNENIKYRTLILLTLDSGCRRSEICALRWNDIDFENHTIRINKSLKVIHGVLDEKTTKTQSSKREIEISDYVIELLKEYKEWQQSYIKTRGNKWHGQDRVFTSKDGDYMHPSTCGHTLKKIIDKYGLDYLCFHGLRHTNASLLINSGVNPKAVAQRLGHSTIDTTMDIYSHVFDTAKKECADRLNEVFKNT